MRSMILAALLSVTAYGAEPTKLATLPKIEEDVDIVKVAIVDTGFDMKSKWAAWFETPPKLCGTWNFVDKKMKDGKEVDNPDVMDNHGHGTHIAGLIAQYAGAAPHCLMIMKYYSKTGSDKDNLTNTIKSFRKAIEMDADIINYSGGGIAPSPEECAVIKEALDKDIIVVAAAGNEGVEIGARKYWPVMCDPRVIGVTAIDKAKIILPTSNFSKTKGIRMEEEFGKDIISTLPNDQYGYMTGTSQATAIMSGKLTNHLYIMRKSHYGRLLLKKASGWGK